MQSQHLFRVKISTRTTSSPVTVANTTPQVTTPVARILVDTGCSPPLHRHTSPPSFRPKLSASRHPATVEISSLPSGSLSETVESFQNHPERSEGDSCFEDAPQVTYVTALSDPFAPLHLSVDPLTGRPHHIGSVVGTSESSFLLPPSFFLPPASMMASGASSGGAALSAVGPQQDLTAHESQFSLKWNNHTSTFCHVLSALREKDKYSDVTLACEGRFYNVHRLVLGICSDYFDAMLERTPCKHPVIVLKDIKAEDLESLLSYMYIGEVSVSQSDLGRLIKAAELLCIKGLAVPDEPPPGYADAGLAATVVREKHPGLIYATSEGNVMTFVAHAPQPEQQLQPVSEPNFRSTRSNTMPNKKRRKEENVSSSSSSNVAMVATNPLLVAAAGNASSCPSASSGGVLSTTVSVDETGAGALVYHHSSPALQASSPPTSSAALNGRTVGVVSESLVKEEESVDTEEGGVVASVLAGKSPTISYVVTTDHAGNLHAQPHDPRFETHTEAGGDHSSGDGGGAHQPQPLAEAVAEALAGPSGMQSWLSGGELSQASFSAVETYAGGGGELGQHALKAQQQASAHLPLDGAGGNNSNSSTTTTSTTTVTVAAVAAGSNIVGNASIVGTIIPAATAKRMCLNTFTSTSSDSASAATSSTASSVSAATVTTGVVPSNSSSNQLTCPHCYRNTFRQTSDLKRHIRIHTGEKPYQCNSCPYKASRKDLLHTHCAKIHHYGYTSSKSESKETNKEEKESGKRKWNASNSENKEWDW